MEKFIAALGQRLRSAREKAGLKQQEIAVALGIKQPTYSQYEAGTRVPTLETFGQLTKVLGVSADFLLFGGDEETAQIPEHTEGLTAKDRRLLGSRHEELLSHIKDLHRLLEEKSRYWPLLVDAERKRNDELFHEVERLRVEYFTELDKSRAELARRLQVLEAQRKSEVEKATKIRQELEEEAKAQKKKFG